ncbi:TldD/PmbA family protein [Candidatus Micrarchaeota archaeon]|nr:TldD/PmbA family protein [Candidatus Micrarchaeota archaeon]
MPQAQKNSSNNPQSIYSLADFVELELESIPASYADARLIRVPFVSVSVKKFDVEVEENVSFGLGVRVLKNGSWGFASTNSEAKQSIRKTVQTALKLASLSRGNAKLSEENAVKATTHTPVKIALESESLDLKVKRALDLRELLKGEKIIDQSVRYADSSSEKVFLNSQGARVSQSISRVSCYSSAVAKENGNTSTGFERIAGVGGLELLKGAEEKAEKARKKAIDLLNAKPAKSGSYTIIIDGEMSGVLAHEAVGHACEADAVLAGDSILEGKIGAQVAAESVSIFDDASIGGANGSFFFDDEGVEGKKKFLVKNGVLAGFLHSRETAAKFGVSSTGSCRAMGYSNAPIVRMSNTFFEKGDCSEDDLFDLRKGVYLKGMKGGCVQTKNGTYVFTAEEAWEIENGEKKTRLRDVMLSGEILETLKNVEAVGKDFETSPGTCGKQGQGVPVSDGGPHLKIKNVLVGGR